MMTAQHDNTILEHEPSTPERSEEVEEVEERMGTTTTTPNHDNENENDIENAIITTEHDPAPPQRVQVQGLPLDWTQLGVNTTASGDDNQNGDHPIVLRYPSDVVDSISMEETELCIVGTAGQKITVIGNDFSRTVNTEMTSLILRSHIIRKMEGLQYFTKLDLLELYDNQIDTLSNLNDGMNGGPGATLRVLDMSYNSIRDMQPVQCCPHLQELYLANNKLRDIAGLKGLSKLRKLDLGANRIRVMDPQELSGLVHLEDLWIGKNKIEMIQGLEQLTKLRRLDVQSNRLTTIENLTSQCATLEELFLSHNAITTEGASMATGLAQTFQQLSIIDLSRNRLTTCQPFAHLSTLEELWVSGNKIASFTDVEALRQLPGLETIYLEYNPLQSEPLYRKTLAELLPSLKQIDANLIGHVPYVAAPRTSTTPPHLLAETEEQRLRRLQDMVVARAQRETHGDGNDAPRNHE